MAETVYPFPASEIHTQCEVFSSQIHMAPRFPAKQAVEATLRFSKLHEVLEETPG
jgi:hypothetical protein